MGQIFLGIRLQCAQCHHHPYEKWSQDDYYGLSAFFTTLENKPARPGEGAFLHRSKTAQAKNPSSEENIGPALPGRGSLDLSPGEDPRQILADWVIGPENPYFARMIANRYWKHFFGRGLIDPEDDMRVTNPPTHPALLDGLALSFVESGYDLKELVRTICNSKVFYFCKHVNILRTCVAVKKASAAISKRAQCHQEGVLFLQGRHWNT